MDVFAGALAAVLALGAPWTIVLQRRVRSLRQQSITDPLTGAYNRRHMEACLTLAVERRNRTGERTSLLLFDVDRFKAINDEVGHAAGDNALKRLVDIVRARARQLDVLFRSGGEEFALLLTGAGFTAALDVAEDLRSRVATDEVLPGRSVTISLGVSELRDGHSVEGWIEEADAALYLAKQSGRNRVAGLRSSGTVVKLDPRNRQLRVTVPLLTRTK